MIKFSSARDGAKLLIWTGRGYQSQREHPVQVYIMNLASLRAQLTHIALCAVPCFLVFVRFIRCRVCLVISRYKLSNSFPFPDYEGESRMKTLRFTKPRLVVWTRNGQAWSSGCCPYGADVDARAECSLLYGRMQLVLCLVSTSLLGKHRLIYDEHNFRLIVLINSCDDAKTIETNERSYICDVHNSRELMIA